MHRIPVEEASTLSKTMLLTHHHPSSNVSILSRLNCTEPNQFDQAQSKEETIRTESLFFSCNGNDSHDLNKRLN